MWYKKNITVYIYVVRQQKLMIHLTATSATYSHNRYNQVVTITMATEVEISPLRGLNDFLLESARFQMPNYKDLDKWANRVINNLLYYQTNYLVTSVIIFLVVG